MNLVAYLTHARHSLLLGAGMVLIAGSLARAAEFHLRSECTTEGGLVLLADVADVHAADPDEAKALGAIDLIAAPCDGQKRFLRLREIQDLLTLRGLNLRQHRFSGASQVKIVGQIEARPRADKAAAPSASTPQIAEAARAAIVQYLERQQPDVDSWNVKVQLESAQLKQLAPALRSLQADGGTKPWTGPQEFMLSGPGGLRVPVAAEVTLPPMIVVATQSLGRGMIVRPSDVRLQAGQPSQGRAQVFQSLDEVIGKEVTRQVAEGQILDDQYVRPQLLVRRGEIVTIYARTAGIQVRVSARSRDEGSLGELVTVESLAKRETYFARVSGPQSCEVYAHAVTAAEDQASRPANAQRLAAVKAASAASAVPVSAQSAGNPQP